VAINTDIQSQKVILDFEGSIEKILFGEGSFFLNQEEEKQTLSLTLHPRSGLILT
jgi:hypothetical protein